MTERDDSLHVVFGATGAIGGAVVTELVHAGRGMRAVSRGGQAPDGAQGVAADVSDPAQAARAAVGASVIYHCASPLYTRWPELFPALTSSILGAAQSSAAKLVFADNLYAYGPVDGPLRAGHLSAVLIPAHGVSPGLGAPAVFPRGRDGSRGAFSTSSSARWNPRLPNLLRTRRRASRPGPQRRLARDRPKVSPTDSGQWPESAARLRVLRVRNPCRLACVSGHGCRHAARH
jgi:uncharacterized protein YbjT (DUF2867 family)